MLESYEAIFENGQLKWLTSEPKVSKARVIVTIVEEVMPPHIRRVPPASIAGKGRTLGDLLSSMIEEIDWECLQNSIHT